MDFIKLKANAKINLSLNVCGIEGNLHTLDMVMASVDLYDEVTAAKRADDKVCITYSNPDIPVGQDSVTRAVALFCEQFGAVGMNITVQKNIPLAAGLGGSGVDAAAVLLALQSLYTTNFDLVQLASKIGSDVAYQLQGGFARVEGTGNTITYFNSDKVFYIVIAMSAGGVLSKDAYRLFDEMYVKKEKYVADNDTIIKKLTAKGGFTDTDYPLFANALCKPAIHLNLSIIDTLEALHASGALHAVMTGSGAACIGFYADTKTARAAAKAIKQKGLYAKAAKTVSKGIQIALNV